MNNINPQYAGSSFIIVSCILILLGYLLQSVVAYSKAYEKIENDSASVLQKTFFDGKFENTWITVATIFFGPLVISWISNIHELLKITQDVKALATLLLSMLLIFITLEFSLLASLNSSNRAWKGLLLVAVILDIASVAVITVIKNINPDYNYLLYGLGGLALLSSFMIILFAHIAGSNNE